MGRRKKQATTTKTTFSAIVKRAAFIRGYNDYKWNAKFKEYETVKDQWDYERGRLLAAAIPGRMKIPSVEAIEAFRQLYLEKAIT